MELNNINHIIKYHGINIQLFAGEKTEKATPKKKQDARKKGQVLQSREISSALVLLFIFVGLRIFGEGSIREVVNFIDRVISVYWVEKNMFSIEDLRIIFTDAVLVIFKAVAPILVIAMLTGLLASYSQVGFLFTLENLGVKFNRINPLSGFKRMFSIRAIVDMFKSIFKVLIISTVAYVYLNGEKSKIFNLMDMELSAIGQYIAFTSLNVAIIICVALLILGVLDYGYQWWDYEKNLRMSKDEIKEEYKQTEGNPEIKAKIKEKQRQISMRRMLQDVPKADVVITNPTHFAVAIKYDTEKNPAPFVTAKGQDFMAQRIREIAKENKVEIVENKPLARALFDKVDVGTAIPADLFQAVAEVLAFVYKLKGKAG